MPASLSNQNISNTYRGLLHAQGDALQATGNIVITDGSGQSTSLSLGTAGQGITVTGPTQLDSIYATSAYLSSLIMEGYAGIVSPNTPKAWAVFAGNDGSLKTSYNVLTATTTVDGEYEITFANALASSNYVVQTSLQMDNAAIGGRMVCSHVMSAPPPSTTSFKMKTYRMLANSAIEQFRPERVFITVYHA
jgi:hypothetical protein